ncbi:hypothetical protein [Piscinibacter koreensis]|uniref:Uncharacterized protein n=1 Tax=Piscinibacter koreensis TaxID=2742824 RepID=A0A7Y6TYN3_9BURK|nr:hypothetical protein [Schlegelella koreensis]NUZ08389.1 hypothetical protein [Schlegelella koreensis]
MLELHKRSHAGDFSGTCTRHRNPSAPQQQKSKQTQRSITAMLDAAIAEPDRLAKSFGSITS